MATLQHIHRLARRSVTTTKRKPSMQNITPPIQFSLILPPHILKSDNPPLRSSYFTLHLHPLGKYPPVFRSTAHECVDQHQVRFQQGLVVRLEDLGARAAQALEPLEKNLRCPAEVEVVNSPGVEDVVVLWRAESAVVGGGGGGCGRRGRVRGYGVKGEVFAGEGYELSVDFWEEVGGEG